jgi:hypothetical protein
MVDRPNPSAPANARPSADGAPPDVPPADVAAAGTVGAARVALADAVAEYCHASSDPARRSAARAARARAVARAVEYAAALRAEGADAERVIDAVGGAVTMAAAFCDPGRQAAALRAMLLRAVGVG